jgi:hypothetical protein
VSTDFIRGISFALQEDDVILLEKWLRTYYAFTIKNTLRIFEECAALSFYGWT